MSKVKTLEITDLWFKSSFSLPNYQKKKKNMKIPPNLIGEITMKYLQENNSVLCHSKISKINDNKKKKKKNFEE